MINIFFERDLPAGIWTLLVHPVKVVDGRFHAWIERDDHGRSRFVDGDGECTLSAIACGDKSIVVGAYSALPGSGLLRPTENTSRGSTHPRGKGEGRERPDLSAPGQDVFIPALSRPMPDSASETSAAAAVVTGAIALVLAQAHAKGKSLDVDAIRNIMIDSAKTRRDDIIGQTWHKHLGHGRVSVSAAFDLLP